MKNYIYSILILLITGVHVYGQSPSWAVNENNFQYTMSIVAFVNIDGNTLANANDKVAVFVNGECRGVSNLVYVASEDKFYAYLTIFSNENNEVLNFKIYDSVNDEVKDVEKTKNFEINQHYGNLFQAYSFASPPLSNEAEIIGFSFNEISINSSSINVSQISFDVDRDESVTNLNAVFELSEGAKLFIGTVSQISDENSIDFSSGSIQFQVLSEDQSVLKQWEVFVNLSYGTAVFYKKNAVCYEGGVIKVQFTEDDVNAILRKEGETHAKQMIHDGETIFSDLEIGTYYVLVGGNLKEIVINLNE